jgi:hypothetical protein
MITCYDKFNKTLSFARGPIPGPGPASVRVGAVAKIGWLQDWVDDDGGGKRVAR